MKYMAITFLLITSTISGQDLEPFLEKIQLEREEYFSNEIPPKFTFVYQSIITNQSEIKNALVKYCDSLDIKLKLDTVIYFEAVHNPTMDVFGMLWTPSLQISYKIEFNENINFFPINYTIRAFEYYLRDVINWNKNITDRSYYYTTMAGPFQIICSYYVNNRTRTAAFVEYDKSSNIIHLKEMPYDDFKPRVLRKE